MLRSIAGDFGDVAVRDWDCIWLARALERDNLPEDVRGKEPPRASGATKPELESEDLNDDQFASALYRANLIPRVVRKALEAANHSLTSPN